MAQHAFVLVGISKGIQHQQVLPVHSKSFRTKHKFKGQILDYSNTDTLPSGAGWLEWMSAVTAAVPKDTTCLMMPDNSKEMRQHLYSTSTNPRYLESGHSNFPSPTCN